jgi:enamine deaminase RidA (YjgF/YER057c/UK114 family)
MRKLVSSGSPFEPRIGFSRAVRVGQIVVVSGTAPIAPDGAVAD